MILNFENDKFSVSFHPCKDVCTDIRNQSIKYAISLKEQYNDNLALSLSSGLDCQLVLHSFYESGIDLKCIFLYLPGYNDTESEQISILEKKYNFRCEIIEINVDKNKDAILNLSKTYNIHPWQIVFYYYFLKINDNYNLIKGLGGPDFIRVEDKFKLIESYNSVETSKIRAYILANKKNNLICWEKNDSILLSLLKDSILQHYFYSYNYYEKTHLRISNRSKSKISPIHRWDLFLKPFVYADHWGEELEYFPKVVGCEKIDFIAEYAEHNYRENLVCIDVLDLVDHLENGVNVKTFFPDQTLRF